MISAKSVGPPLVLWSLIQNSSQMGTIFRQHAQIVNAVRNSLHMRVSTNWNHTSSFVHAQYNAYNFAESAVMSLVFPGSITEMIPKSPTCWNLQRYSIILFPGDWVATSACHPIWWKPFLGGPTAMITFTFATRARIGPVLHLSRIWSTALGLPENTASTVPSLQFRTQPLRHSFVAFSIVHFL